MTARAGEGVWCRGQAVARRLNRKEQAVAGEERPEGSGSAGGRFRGAARDTEQEGAVTALRCSFCGKDKSRVERMIAGPNGVFICNECIVLCNAILAESKGKE